MDDGGDVDNAMAALLALVAAQGVVRVRGRGAAAGVGAGAGDGAGAGAAEIAMGCAVWAAGAAPRTKVSVVPEGSETCWPVAAAATVAGALT